MKRSTRIVASALCAALGFASPLAAQTRSHGSGVNWDGDHGGVNWDGGHAYRGGDYNGYPIDIPRVERVPVPKPSIIASDRRPAADERRRDRHRNRPRP
ncbi:MAG: hypothetical protein WBL20_06510 [Sphingobium sp.]